MEALLVYWQVEWPAPDHTPVYRSHFKTEHQCMRFISALTREIMHDHEVLGRYYFDTHECVIVIWTYEPRDSGQ